MINFFRKLLGDNDSVSSKRFVGLVAAMCLCITMVVSSFVSLKTPPSDTLIEAVLWLALGSLGFTSIEKFSNYKRRDRPDKDSETNS